MSSAGYLSRAKIYTTCSLTALPSLTLKYRVVILTRNRYSRLGLWKSIGELDKASRSPSAESWS